ncbi:MAG: ATP-binding cassette domain-containing protein [Chthoniobacterales bacterium]
MNLRLQNIRLRVGTFALEIDAAFDHPITGIFGPSGAGKTSLLDLIAGLRQPDAGAIVLENEVLFDANNGCDLPPRFRRIGYVPQDLALFPHLSVRGNLRYGQRRVSAKNGAFTLEHVAEAMEISPLLERNVTNLSGGEQQRVAFARALLSSPRLLLLDEPMSSLDLKLKTRLIVLLHRIREEFRVPLLYVTHDAQELRTLCDEVCVLEKGRLVGRGSPAVILDRDR